ncbi:hypothetical protein EVAR_29123_1 [Eumeta japonica]|uniref:Uncharacterized protein n=1 Tax=Eumeta variegata TaxID=151549 RepID=A0A4C1VCK1_EUMVA|nr:hypothetical protein EVAR_29123_1 [Eumeta japonica]
MLIFSPTLPVFKGTRVYVMHLLPFPRCNREKIGLRQKIVYEVYGCRTPAIKIVMMIFMLNDMNTAIEMTTKFSDRNKIIEIQYINTKILDTKSSTIGKASGEKEDTKDDFLAIEQMRKVGLNSTRLSLPLYILALTILMQVDLNTYQRGPERY